ncbi:MAG: cbb3-type cytochrome c oxidase subunit 3 [Alphaproteobacteria bacterium]|nr:cbb3-type cytochrome c oxidase subunit 3 [Alphaproteobacteria bacterium]
MLNSLLDAAPVCSLLLFFSIFVGISLWVMRPSLRERFDNYAHIPLKEKSDA